MNWMSRKKKRDNIVNKAEDSCAKRMKLGMGRRKEWHIGVSVKVLLEKEERVKNKGNNKTE